MKVIKKNQIIIYIVVLILMVAGYLNYSSKTQDELALETSIQMADIGDATLVNSNDIVEENVANTNVANTNVVNTINEDVNENEKTNEVSNNVVSNESDYFVKSKLERNTMYSQMIESYEKILNSTNSLETQKQSATEEIEKINNVKNSIMICENLISTKGFENNIIFVNKDSVNVIIGAKEISQEEIAQIQNIISREMNADIENIHISNK